MKKVSVIVSSVFLAATLFSCGAATEKKVEENTEIKEEVVTAEAVNYQINTEESTVNWSGELLGIYKHEGVVNMTEGSLEMTGNQITAGSFVVNMNTIIPTDDQFDVKEGKTPEKLAGHLKSADFFLVDSFPHARFEVISFNPETNSLLGNLTIRGISKEETVKEVTIDETTNTAKGVLVFNRQDYNVAYKMSAKDMVISDNINLNIALKMM